MSWSKIYKWLGIGCALAGFITGYDAVIGSAIVLLLWHELEEIKEKIDELMPAYPQIEVSFTPTEKESHD